ncbi:hypothetical protein GCM10011487_27670 [Steroidobacter agaridevorans]|uniref:Uncharacterized protein n=1 Tax=Steroidobacter agaridevorans TaxID=2695856 RepID=A0A829YBV7_9GAMM|nr:hypothetical protein [Steroidobacter agaridevorans]GFE80767.1 hypothetical protein GCM10011487_27670 [Steroidobacter agaridevorans]GFE87868.1 hypothetical protein GCM10011488_28220 [Steroidobacter agaridevorans]
MTQTHDSKVRDAISDPTREYRKPIDVVKDDQLDHDEKLRILESWKKDAELLSVAQDENMAGGERPQLQDVMLAIQELERTRGSIN